MRCDQHCSFNVVADVVDVQLLAIGHCNRNTLLLQMRIG